MPTPPQQPGQQASNTPSSEPFYSSFSSAPISSPSYAQAPPVGSGEFGVTEHQNPYAGMGYDTLPDPPGTAQPQQTAPIAVPFDPAAPQGRAGWSTTPDYTSEPPSVEDLHRAPGNPYADHSGRAVAPAGTSPAPVPASMPASSPATYTPPRGTQSGPQDPHPPKKGRAMGCLALFLAIGFVAVLVLGGIGYLIDVWDEREVHTLATVPDDELYAGLCFETLEYPRSNHLQPVPCEKPHRFEVVQNHDLGGGTYPGGDELSETARSVCSGLASTAADALNSRRVGHYALYPSQSGWDSGDYTLTCFISVAGTSRLVGSYTDGDARVE